MNARLLALGLLVLGGAAGAQPSTIGHGKEVFEHYCKPCHGDGRGDDGAPMLPGTHSLTLKYRGQKPGLLEQRTDLPADLIRAVVRSGVASMPPFRKTEVTDDDLAAVAAYLADAAKRHNEEGIGR